jgi:TolB-like protein/Flp pilus assembly protein TadD
MESLSSLRRALAELKRRRVFRVAAVYAATAFVVWQAAAIAFPALHLPSWTLTLVVVLAILGFPVALVLAWAFEVTPDGVRRSAVVERPGGSGRAQGAERSPGQRFVAALVGVGLLAGVAAGGWYLVGGTEGDVTDRSIAVLPFADMGGVESAQFTMGVHADLLTRLSNIAGLEVISRTSVARYRETDLPLPEIARELGVAWVVEGAVQQAGGTIQVNVQLVDPRSDTHAWADQYRRDFTAENLFAIQSEVTREIAGALQARVTPEEERRVDRRPTGSLEAYRYYAQGRSLLEQRSETAIRSAMSHFRSALELDSTYAPAWAALAEAETARQGYYGGTSDAGFARAREAARRALALDPDLAEAHASAGFVHLYTRQGPAALRAFREALRLEPSLAQAHRWLGVLLDALGRPGALSHLRRAVALNPVTPEAHADLAGALLVRGSAEEALRHARRGRVIEPGYGLSRFLEVMALYHLGRREEARALLREVRAAPWRPTLHRAAGALLQVAEGDSVGAREVLERLRDEPDGWAEAWVHAALGETDAAFRALRGIESWGMGEAIMFRHGYPDVMAPLEADRRYQGLLRELNRGWGLQPDGSLPREAP